MIEAKYISKYIYFYEAPIHSHYLQVDNFACKILSVIFCDWNRVYREGMVVERGQYILYVLVEKNIYWGGGNVMFCVMVGLC